MLSAHQALSYLCLNLLLWTLTYILRPSFMGVPCSTHMSLPLFRCKAEGTRAQVTGGSPASLQNAGQGSQSLRCGICPQLGKYADVGTALTCQLGLTEAKSFLKGRPEGSGIIDLAVLNLKPKLTSILVPSLVNSRCSTWSTQHRAEQGQKGPVTSRLGEPGQGFNLRKATFL